LGLLTEVGGVYSPRSHPAKTRMMKGFKGGGDTADTHGATKSKFFGFGSKKKSNKPEYTGDMKHGKACGKVCFVLVYLLLASAAPRLFYPYISSAQKLYRMWSLFNINDSMACL